MYILYARCVHRSVTYEHILPCMMCVACLETYLIIKSVLLRIQLLVIMLVSKRLQSCDCFNKRASWTDPGKPVTKFLMNIFELQTIGMYSEWYSSYYGRCVLYQRGQKKAHWVQSMTLGIPATAQKSLFILSNLPLLMCVRQVDIFGGNVP